MKTSKAVLLAVLRTRHADDRPLLAQRLPAEFDTDDVPGLLETLGLREEDPLGASAQRACELSALDGDPHCISHPDWPQDWRRRRYPHLVAEITRRDLPR